ncbi:hypothetical protein N0V83_008367 [Neocucurbitaria cava]|uniref:Uncharacterized protein n=1 Tax=Neocucurbitaria cava TaxID=798079 RepID=A0A9W8Y3E3_9PLEO|nr:hypothetical protein N0V83_008367 [Neocucurbitaria cava]
MAALSEQFTRTSVNLPVGNPHHEDRRMSLSRKDQSELNLTTMASMEVSHFNTHSIHSSFSESFGDSSSEDFTMPTPTLMESAIECDAFIALRELGMLVARRRGLKADCFIESLMMLFSNAAEADAHPEDAEDQVLQQTSMRYSLGDTEEPCHPEASTSRRNRRKIQSQSQLSSNQRRHRHFSFEPGDDQVQGLEEEFMLHKAWDSGSSDAETRTSTRLRNSTPHSHLSNSQSLPQVLLIDLQKPSKIPSPMQTLGRIRRESSVSSLQSGSARPSDDRRNSRSSVATAFRASSNVSLRTISNSRSSSMHNLPKADFSLLAKDSPRNLRFNSATALAAARAADKSSVCRGNSAGSSAGSPIASCSNIKYTT